MIPLLSIPVLNRYDLLDENLNSIDFPIEEILIINNGKEIYNPKRKDLNIKVLNLPSNLGMAGSWNLTIKLYPHKPYWVFSSADIYFPPGSLSQIDNNSGKLKLVVSTEGFSCFSVGENVVRKVGLFDEYFYPYLFEDSDYFDRARIVSEKSQDKEFAIVQNLPSVISVGGPAQTINSDKKLFQKYSETRDENEKYYLFKKQNNYNTHKGWDIDRRREHEWL